MHTLQSIAYFAKNCTSAYKNMEIKKTAGKFFWELFDQIILTLVGLVWTNHKRKNPMNYSTNLSSEAKSANYELADKISDETLKKMQEIAAWNQRKKETGRFISKH